ncbi:hypothetical protein [Vibrio rumoiensis]|uniref:Uncharacterized protein n=1 Tax=Vibrio rumoiensis 1S-45 TaxID=1188252 RepID=A0A1E5E3X0_9VIBR|nr:hypothetical protein [Vibrio rumoiensis]OEF27206.1 hypothetical protein A1QC_06755 [Vibrio rumoiensis 1S-45]
MRQGLLAVTLLLNAVLWVPLGHAIEITQEEVTSWLNNSQVHQSVDNIYQDVLLDKARVVEKALAQIPLPKQEVVRYLLLRKIEMERLVLTPRMSIFIKSQQQHSPVYSVSDNGDGYTAIMPAFNSSLIANRLISNWKQDQTTIDFIIAVESQDLDLPNWLKGNSQLTKEHEALLLKEADSLSPQALDYLVNQLVGTSLIKWVPSTAVVIKLAQLTEDQRMYNLLWKMKGNEDSQNEVRRLASVGNAFSVKQLIEASQNPALKNTAIGELVNIQPMSLEAKDFLVDKLNHVDDGVLVAQALSDSPHRDWLVNLLESGGVKKSQSLMQALVTHE